jgi:hypothetical protein
LGSSQENIVDGRVVSSGVVVFHAYINEMHGSKSKTPSKKVSSGSVARRDLIPTLKG